MQNSNTIKFLTFAFTLLLVCTSLDSYSQFYFGASIGNSFINKDLTDLNGDDFKLDENSFGYKIFGGFGSKFIGIRLEYEGLENGSDSNLSMLTLGGTIHLGGKK